MNITQNKKKDELRDDPLVDFLTKVKISITKYNRQIISVAVAVALIYGGYMAYTSMKKSTISQAKQKFGSAMLLYSEKKEAEAVAGFKEVIEKFGSTAHAAYSAYMIGQISIEKAQYDDAIKWFEKGYEAGDNAGFIRGSCVEALGVCYDAINDQKKAISFFEKALQDQSIAYRHPDIRWRLALLNKKLGDKEKVMYYCNKIVADTLAYNLKQKAENLLVETQLM